MLVVLVVRVTARGASSTNKKLIKRFLCARTSIKTHVIIASTAEAGLQD